MVKTCCVAFCRQESYRGCGLSFHSFPTDPILKQAWLDAIKRDEVAKRAVVCSRHFKVEDYVSPSSNKLRPSVVPSVIPPEDLDVTVTKICRVCLALDVKMYAINELELNEMFECVTGIADEELKHEVYENICWECVARLSSASAFKDKALLADSLLQGLLETGDEIKTKHIKAIKDNYSILNPTLTVNRVFHSMEYYREDTSKKNIKIEYIDYEKLHPIEEENIPKDDTIATNTRSNLKNRKIESKFETMPKILDNESDFCDYEFLEEDHVLNSNQNRVKNEIKEETFSVDTNTSIEDIKSEVNISDNDENLFNDNLNDSDIFEDDDDESRTYLTFDNDSLTGDENLTDYRDTFFDDNNGDEVKIESIEMLEDFDLDPLDSLHEESSLYNNNGSIIDHDYIPQSKENKIIEKENAKKHLVTKTKKVANRKKLESKIVGLDDNMTDEYRQSVKRQIAILKRLENSQYVRKKPNEIDLSFFTVTKRSYEEQIRDIENRKESTKYKEAPYKCDICYMHYYKLRTLLVHKEKHTDAWGKFECFICRMRHRNKRGLRQHLTDRHVHFYKCNKCSFGTMTRFTVRRHIDYHKGKKFQCPHCDMVFTKSTTYFGHLRLKHLCDFACELCGYMFLSKHGVATHKCYKHANELDKKLEGPHCEVCDVTFASQEAHDRHLRLSRKHTHESDPNRLRNEHVSKRSIVEKRPENETPKICEHCNMPYPNRRYGQHLRRFHPEIHRAKLLESRSQWKRKYSSDNMCEHCGKLYPSKAVLRDHMWVHTGEKYYKCDKCPKSFSTRQGQRIHEQYLHQGRKGDAVCPVCGKTLLHTSNLKKHMFSHTGLKPHTCSICGKTFAWVYELKSHVNHVHLNQPWPKRVRHRQRRASTQHSTEE